MSKLDGEDSGLGWYMLLQPAAALPTAELGQDHFVRTFGAGERVQVVELARLEKDHKIRGRVSSGGWISIKDTKSGRAWAQRVTGETPEGANQTDAAAKTAAAVLAVVTAKPPSSAPKASGGGADSLPGGWKI